jgi:hypothetical protein
MSEWNDRMVAADELQANGVADDVAGRMPLDEVEPFSEMELVVDSAIAQFRGIVNRELAERLSDDEALMIRLARVRRANRWLEDAPEHHYIDDLATYGYDTVRLWIRLVLASGQRTVGLADEDVAEISKETVARAISCIYDGSALRDETQRKTAFLVQCVDQLPHAYRSWRIKTEVLNFEELDESAAAGEALVDCLRRCLARRRAMRLMQTWGYTEQDINESIALTHMALRLPPEMTA